MSRLLTYGKHVIVLDADGGNVIASRDTYPFRLDLRTLLGAVWDSVLKRWIVPNSTLDAVETTLAPLLAKYEADFAEKRKEASKNAATTRRMRAGRWTDEEREKLQANYATWDANGGTESEYVMSIAWDSLCVSCKRPIFRIVPDVKRNQCECGQRF